MFDANCQGKEEIFFPGKGQAHLVKKAKDICAACVVQEECENYADRHDTEHGVWAGRLRQESGRPPRPDEEA